MLFNVSALMREGMGATREYDVDDVLEADVEPPEPVRGHVKMLRTKAGLLVTAFLSMSEPEVCSRCLKPMVEPLSVYFEEEFKATMDVDTGRPVTERPEFDAFLIDSNHMLDLTEAVRQYRETALEIKPLCRPDCMGLCPTCGADLNEEACGCAGLVVDNRLIGLAALLEGGLKD